MIELKDMNEEDRAMCEEWERLYTESGKQFSFEGYDNIERSNLLGALKDYAIPRTPDNYKKAIDLGIEAREKAGVTIDINNYSFDLNDNRALSGEKPDARFFIGIPYRLGKVGLDGCDCMGLAVMFYNANGWLLNKQGEGWEGTKKTFRYVRRYFKRIEKEELEYGDLILHGNHVDIFLGWSPSNKHDYVILNHAINSGDGCTSSKIITIGDTEYTELFDQKAEYFHRKKPINVRILDIYDTQVIRLNLIPNPYERCDPFYYALFRGYDIKTAEKIANEAEQNFYMIDKIINITIEKAERRIKERLYKELEDKQNEYNKKAIAEGWATIDIV